MSNEPKYTDSKDAYKRFHLETPEGGIGISTWGQKTETGYSGGAKLETHLIIKPEELQDLALKPEAVRARIDQFLRNNPIDTGIFEGSRPEFVKPDTKRYNETLDAMTKTVRSEALEGAARNVYFHDHPETGFKIPDEVYKKSLLTMGQLMDEGVKSKGSSFVATATGSGYDYDGVNIIDRQGYHSSFQLSTLMAAKKDELAALRAGGTVTASIDTPPVTAAPQTTGAEAATTTPAEKTNAPAADVKLSRDDIKIAQQLALEAGANLKAYGVDGKFGAVTAKAISVSESTDKEFHDKLVNALGEDKTKALEAMTERTLEGHGLAAGGKRPTAVRTVS